MVLIPNFASRISLFREDVPLRSLNEDSLVFTCPVFPRLVSADGYPTSLDFDPRFVPYRYQQRTEVWGQV